MSQCIGNLSSVNYLLLDHAEDGHLLDLLVQVSEELGGARTDFLQLSHNQLGQV